MRAARCTAQQSAAMLAEFCTAWGPERIEAAYGWKHVPETLGRGVRMYSFTVDGVRVGWGIMELNTHDARDNEAVLSVGVFPDHTRQGHRDSILRWMAAKAKVLGADIASMIVYKVNEEHYLRCLREAKTGSPWVYAGDIWAPAPGYGYFIQTL